VLLLAVGCAPARNTPQQDLAWARWERCQADATGVHVLGVDPDGRIRVESVAAHHRDGMLACLARLDATGERLPEALSVGRPGAP
jgi:hypothetical protein